MLISILKRILIYVIGLFLLSSGVAFSAHCGIGVSPVGTVPVALRDSFALELGLCSTLAMIFYMFVQMALLGKKYKLINLTQIFASFLFGFFIFVAESIMRYICAQIGQPMDPELYAIKLLYLFASFICIGTGVYLYLEAKMINLPADGVFVAFHQRTGISIPKSKIMFDISATALAALIAFTFAPNHEIGFIREGTIIACFAVGMIIGFWKRTLKDKVQKFIYSDLNGDLAQN